MSPTKSIEGEGPNPLDNLKVLSGNVDYVEKTTPSGRCPVIVYAMKIPNALTKFLNENSGTLWEIVSGKLGQTYKKLKSQIGSVAEDEEPLEALRKRIKDAIESDIASDTDKILKCKLLWDQLTCKFLEVGFADELRKWTAGSSSALLVLSHWEQLLEDPFFVPKTEEEKEEFGDGTNVPRNTARKLIDDVRQRKGLPVEEKAVQHATKQRTLARKL